MLEVTLVNELLKGLHRLGARKKEVSPTIEASERRVPFQGNTNLFDRTSLIDAGRLEQVHFAVLQKLVYVGDGLKQAFRTAVRLPLGGHRSLDGEEDLVRVGRLGFEEPGEELEAAFPVVLAVKFSRVEQGGARVDRELHGFERLSIRGGWKGAEQSESTAETESEDWDAPTERGGQGWRSRVASVKFPAALRIQLARTRLPGEVHETVAWTVDSSQ